MGWVRGKPAIDHMLGALFSHVKLLNRKLREQSNLFNAIWLLNIIGSHWKLDQRQVGFWARNFHKTRKKDCLGSLGLFFGRGVLVKPFDVCDEPIGTNLGGNKREFGAKESNLSDPRLLWAFVSFLIGLLNHRVLGLARSVCVCAL